jgi:signal transduction histidine kinase
MEDIRSIIHFSASLKIVFSILLWVYYFQHTDTQSTRTIAISNLCSGIGLFIYSVFPYPVEVINLSLFNLFVITGDSLFLVGIWQLKGKRINHLFIVTAVSLSILQTIYFTSIHRHDGIRVGINSLIYCSIALYLLIEFIEPLRKTFKSFYIFNLVIFLLYCLLMVVRAIFAFPNTTINLFASSAMNYFMFLFIVFSQTLAVFCYIIVLNHMLHDRLRKQIEVRDKFYAIIGHDLRSPISSIQVLCELAENYENGEGKSQTVGMISSIAKQTDKLLMSILEWINLQHDESINIQKINIYDILRQEEELFQNLTKIKRIKYAFTADIEPTVLADANMLRTILRNLITNAIKFTKPEGSISVSITHDSTYVNIHVLDTGVGMSPDKVQSLFVGTSVAPEKGTQNEYGTGLGLALCREFAEKQRGKLSASSIEGKGSIFTLSLPKG